MNALLEKLLALDAGLLALAKVTVILIVAGILQLALRWNRPQWQVLLWRGAWLSIVVTLFASIALPAWEVNVAITEPAVSDHATARSHTFPTEYSPTESPVVALPPVGNGASVGGEQPQLTNAWTWPQPMTMALTIGFGMTSLLLTRWMRNYLSLLALRRRARPASATVSALANDVAKEMGVRLNPRVFISSEISSPCTVSARNPIILLPNPRDPDIRAILAHEIAHVRSCDLLWIWMMDWLAAILWFHPLCWFMRQDHLFACEAAGDSAAATTLKDREFYATALARLALAAEHRHSGAAVGMVRSAQIVRRLRLLQHGREAQSISPFKISLATILALIAALGIGTLEFGMAQEKRENVESKSSSDSGKGTKRMDSMALQLRALRLDRLGNYYEPNHLGDFRKPLDHEALTHLAANPRQDRFKLKILICRAAAEKDRRYLYMLDQKELRKDPWIDIALLAYDYSVNNNRVALAEILGRHASESPGSDSDTVLVLSFIDEWERSIPAILKHFEKGTDGAGGLAESGFWYTRKYLYPKKLRQYVEKFQLDPVESFRGLDLTKVPSTTHARELPMVWVASPPGSQGYKIKGDVIDFRLLFEGTVYFVPKANQFYVSHALVSDESTFYGPFDGNPFETLNLAEDLQDHALRLDDPMARHRAREVLKELVSSESPDMRRLGLEIGGRVKAKTAEQTYHNRSAKEWDDLLSNFSSRDRDLLKLIGYGPPDLEIPKAAVPMLVHLVQSGKPATKCRSLGTLRKLKYPSNEVIDCLLGALSDSESRGCRYRAGYVLGSYQSRSSYIVPRLTAMMAEGNETLREMAALALGGLGPAAEEALQALEALGSDSSKE